MEGAETKKASQSHRGGFIKTVKAALIFPKTGQELAPDPRLERGGCRGVVGPIPRPLWMRSRVNQLFN